MVDACREKHLSRRANAAKSAVSELVLVAKACGKDAEEELPVSAGLGPRRSKAEIEETEKRSSLRWKDSDENLRLR
ncbi:hypothetical protein EUTSA_v10022949mg [Eutrema salsugineum]|uniref:Uncharacterized protein n=1 Tax=Eutrema salsugineum TaxID=72664 RepID=V4M498_EUTSA|nr:hypothetical protein EUTSA_v10022949mg [Eutrema salsugineum]